MLLGPILIPLYVGIVSNFTSEWKNTRRSLFPTNRARGTARKSWQKQVLSLTAVHWSVFVVCFCFVFLAQWWGVYVTALLSNNPGNTIIDWKLVGIHRPDVVSTNLALVISFLAYVNVGLWHWFNLTGLVLLYTVSRDYHKLSVSFTPDFDAGYLNDAILAGVFRAVIVAILSATSIKAQACLPTLRC